MVKFLSIITILFLLDGEVKQALSSTETLPVNLPNSSSVSRVANESNNNYSHSIFANANKSLEIPNGHESGGNVSNYLHPENSTSVKNREYPNSTTFNFNATYYNVVMENKTWNSSKKHTPNAKFPNNMRTTGNQSNSISFIPKTANENSNRISATSLFSSSTNKIDFSTPIYVDGTEKKNNVTRKLIFDEFHFLNKILILSSPRIESEKCRLQSALYERELKKFTSWAFEMYDASTKLPSGVMVGSTFDYGNYDECVQVLADADGETIQGKYCSAEVTFHPHPDYKIPDGPVSENASNSQLHVWHKVQYIFRDIRTRNRNKVQWALCVPASCSHSDVQMHLQDVTDELLRQFDVAIDVTVKPSMCQVDNGFQFSSADIAFVFCIAIILCITFWASTYDMMLQISWFERIKLSDTRHRMLLCFSAKTNFEKLVKVGKSEDQLHCMHGLKFVSMVLIIMGHRLLFVLGKAPIANTDFVERAYSEYAAAILLNGPIIVDTFFTISGFLTSYILLQEFKKRKNISVITFYIHRFIRLTPMYLVVMVFYCTVFVKIGSGALWMEEVGKEQARCLQSWWANLLYINNYVQVDNLCMVQSWYITSDFHFFVIGAIIVKLLINKPAIGKLAIFGGIIASAVCVFYITYDGRLDPILMLYMKTLNDPIKNTLFRRIYIPSHTRATPYFIGLAAGYIRFQIKTSEYKMNRKLVWICWVVSMACFDYSIWISWFFYQPGFFENSPLFNAFYGATHRITWSCGVSWMILAMSTGNGALFDVAFSWKPLVPFSRLSYSALLCHTAIQLYTVASSRAPYYLSIFQLVYMTFADILTSYAVAIPMTLLFEAPIIGMEKILVGRKR